MAGFLDNMKKKFASYGGSGVRARTEKALEAVNKKPAAKPKPKPRSGGMSSDSIEAILNRLSAEKAAKGKANGKILSN